MTEGSPGSGSHRACPAAAFAGGPGWAEPGGAAVSALVGGRAAGPAGGPLPDGPATRRGLRPAVRAGRRRLSPRPDRATSVRVGAACPPACRRLSGRDLGQNAACSCSGRPRPLGGGRLRLRPTCRAAADGQPVSHRLEDGLLHGCRGPPPRAGRRRLTWKATPSSRTAGRVWSWPSATSPSTALRSSPCSGRRESAADWPGRWTLPPCPMAR